MHRTIKALPRLAYRFIQTDPLDRTGKKLIIVAVIFFAVHIIIAWGRTVQ